MPVLVRELLALYAHRGDSGALPRVTPYRDYLAWIAAQDRGAALAAWRAALAGLEEPTRLAPHDPGRVPVAPEQITLALSEPLTAALTRQARQQGLTLNTLIQAAWAILLGRLTGRDDVVFGVTVAGRPPEIAGIESMVGLFINTLPLRIKLPPGQAAARRSSSRCRRASRALMAHQHLGLAEIQGLAGLGRAVRHPGRVRELSARPRQPCGGCRRAAAQRCRRARCHALSFEPGGRAGRAAAAAARLPARPVRARERGGAGGAPGSAAGGGGDGRGPADRHARHSHPRRARAPSWWSGTTRRGRSPSATLPELFAAQVERKPRMRPRWCSRIRA